MSREMEALCTRVIVLFFLLLPFAAFAIPPVLIEAEYDYSTTILTLTFDQELSSEQYHADQVWIAFGPDYETTIRRVATNPDSATISGARLQIPLSVCGFNDEYDREIEYTPYHFKTWGKIFDTARLLVCHQDVASWEIVIGENCVINGEGEGNYGITVEDGVTLTRTGEPVAGPVIESASYDTTMGHLVLTFSDSVQFDLIPEDVSEDNGPGNGRLDNTIIQHEDRNGNGVLEFERDIFPESILFEDNNGLQYRLHYMVQNQLLEVIDPADNTQLRLHLTLHDRIGLEALDLANTTVTFDPWAFTDQEYHGTQETSMSLISYSVVNPLIVEIAQYDMGWNKLTLVTDGPVSPDYTTDFNPGRIEIVTQDSGSFLLSGHSDVIIQQQQITISLVIDNQRQLEEAINDDQIVFVHVLPYMALGIVGEKNAEAEVELGIIPETGSVKAPVADECVFDAEANRLYVHFDIRIEDYLYNTNGLLLTDGAEYLWLRYTSMERVDGNRALVFILTDECAYSLETEFNTNTTALHLFPFTVLQQSKLNGNWDQLVHVQYSSDNRSLVPISIIYVENEEALRLCFDGQLVNTALSASSGITYSNVELSWYEVEAVSATEIRVLLDDASAAAMQELEYLPRVIPIISIAANTFTTYNGTSNADLINLTDGMNLEQFGGEGNLLAGWGQVYSVPSFEKFAPEPTEQVFRLRRMSEHVNLYVALNQLRAYEENNGLIPVIEAELDSIVGFIEDSTPTDPNSGAITQLEGYLALDNQDELEYPVDILITDILDEAGKGRNNARSQYYFGSKYVAAEQNQPEMLLLDSHPQVFMQQDSAYVLQHSSFEDEWEVWHSFTGYNAITNLLAHWMMQQVDPDEEAWVVEGISSLCEQFVVGETVFYVNEGLNLLPPLNNTLITMPYEELVATRQDLVNAFLFFEYLYERYGGDELIQSVASNADNGMASVHSVLNDIQPTLPEPYRSKSLQEIYLDYNLACILDRASDTHDDLFLFNNVDFSSAYYYMPQTKWRETDVRPYALSISPWSFSVAYTAYGAYSPNPTLDPEGQFFFDGNDDVTMAVGCIRSTTLSTEHIQDGDFLVENTTLNEANRGSVDLTIPGWALGPENEGDYHKLVTVFSRTDTDVNLYGCPTVVLNDEPDYFIPPTVYAAPTSATSIELRIGLPYWESDPNQMTYLEHKQSIRNHKAEVLSQLSANELDNEGGLTGFTIYRSEYPDHGFEQVAADVTDLIWNDEDLAENNTYYYRVTANYSNPVGESSYTEAYVQTSDQYSQAHIACQVSNYGILGDPFESNPSMEWPIGSGKYYLWHGGFWAGVMFGNQPVISFSEYANHEWQPDNEDVYRTSILGADRFFHSCVYNDLNADFPLGLQVTQTTEMWPEATDQALADVMLIRIAMKNISSDVLKKVYLGWYLDPDIAMGPHGQVNNANYDDYLDFDEERLMPYMYDADSPGSYDDDTGEGGTIPGYIGARVINASNWQPLAHMAWWNWSDDPQTDEAKYSFMNGSHRTFQGRQHMPTPAELGEEPFDYRMFLSVGPYTLRPQDTLFVEIAVMVNDGLESLQATADYVYDMFAGVEDEKAPVNLPHEFSVSRAYPNPFNPVTAVDLAIPVTGDVSIKVYNVLGQAVHNESLHLSAGKHRYMLNANQAGGMLASGVYFMQVNYQNQVSTQRIILLK